MSSFTSNSKARQYAWIILVLAALVGAGEWAVRRQFNREFKFARHFRRQHGNAQTAARELESFSGARIQVIGNSACFGVPVSELEAILRTNGIARSKIDMHAEAGTTIHYWHFWLDRIFWKPRIKADLFVIPFWGGNLADVDRLEVDGLAQLIENPPGIVALFKSGIKPGPEMAQIILAKYWKTFAFRKQIKKRFLVSALPGYARFMTEVNSVNFRHARELNETTSGASSYRSLHEFLKRAQETGANICFVAYPSRPAEDGTRAPLDPEIARMIGSAGMKLIDLHADSELRREDYSDRVHLLPAAVPRWVHRLGEAITSQVKDDALRREQP